MNNIIERYVYDVVRRLPEDQRDEVAKELYSNIQEMLSDHPTKDEIEVVLQSLGHPRTLANDYRGNKRYLISPEWYEDYITVLKIVAIVLGSLALVVGVIDNILNPDATTFIGIFFEVIGKTISDVISAVFNAFAIVTFIFVVIDRATNGGRELKFDSKNLPNLPDKKKRNIGKVGTFVSLVVNVVFGAVFVYLLYMNALYIVWFDGSGLNTSLPLFNSAAVRPFVALFAISVFVTVGLDILKLIDGQWTVRVTIYHTIAKIISAVVGILFVTTENLLNPNFINRVSNTIDVSTDSIYNGLHIAAIVFIVIVVLGSFADIVQTWVKAYKHENEFLKKLGK